MSEFSKQLLDIVDNLPEKPGVYLFKDARGKILYVGKARRLKSRVSSYFRTGSDDRPFIAFLPSELADIDFYVLNTEKEALILENELIKRHHPRYNVMLRDDKNFLFLRIDPSEEFPAVTLVRRRAGDKARYFGPYHSAASARQTLSAIQRYFGLRTCTDYEMHTRTRPCLEYDMGRCLAPCTNPDKALYAASVGDALRFLSGHGREVISDLERRMRDAADALNFESAAVLRDMVSRLREGLERQYVAGESTGNADAIGVAGRAGAMVVVILRFEKGVLRDRAEYRFKDLIALPKDMLDEVILQFYQGVEVPQRVLIPYGESADALAEVLTDRAGHRVRVVTPRGGRVLKWLKMAMENAKEVLRVFLAIENNRENTLKRVAELTGLDGPPELIVGFDMSMLQGRDPVGSMVVFRQGQASKADYRHYSVKTGAIDDFHQMKEVLLRYLKRVGQGDLPRPDLVLLDGGPAQLGAWSEAVKETGQDLFAIGLAKSRILQQDTGERSPERLYIPEKTEENQWKLLVPDQHDPGLHLLMQVRDEAHRFAGRYQRIRRKKTMFRSVLETVPGVGRKRRLMILRHFGDIKALKKASLEDLIAIPGLPDAVARRVYQALHEDE